MVDQLLSALPQTDMGDWQLSITPEFKTGFILSQKLGNLCDSSRKEKIA
jgi:hypothetical protein